MVLSQGKIPGHSGTDFKHRKAFQNRPFLQRNSLPRPRRSSPIPTKQGVNLGRSRIIKKLLQFLLLILSVGAVVYYSWGTPQVASQYLQELEQQEQRSANLERLERYQFLLRSGESYRRAGSWDAAKEEYRLALVAQPEGREALKGLTLTLLAKCYLYGTECRLAASYLRAWPQAVQTELQATAGMIEVGEVESMRMGPFQIQP